MIKLTIVSRVTDGLILCESSDGYMDQHIQTVKGKVKEFHKAVTAYRKSDNSNLSLKQIENAQFGIYYKVTDRVTFTVIVQSTYPPKLANAFLDAIIVPFFDDAKCSYGPSNYISRIEAIENSHFFIKFDRTIKAKKKQFDDPNSLKCVQRLKRELETIQQVIKENMSLLDTRHSDLLRTQQNAKKVSEQSKRFHDGTKKLVWHYWLRKNLVWLVLLLLGVICYFLIF